LDFICQAEENEFFGTENLLFVHFLGILKAFFCLVAIPTLPNRQSHIVTLNIIDLLIRGRQIVLGKSRISLKHSPGRLSCQWSKPME